MTSESRPASVAVGPLAGLTQRRAMPGAAANNAAMPSKPSAPHADAGADAGPQATGPAAGPSAAQGNAERRAARLATPRLTRELRTIAAMLRIACRDHHGDAPRDAQQLCEPCAALLEYARQRLAGCPFGPDKPTCTKCPVHCYGKRQREAVKEVMRHAGPRMLTRHPWLAVAHILDGLRPVPPKPGAPR